MQAPVEPEKPSFRKVVGFAMALNLLASLYAAGILGAVVVYFVGSPFAQILWMIRADTPEVPAVPYPWMWTAVFAALPVVLAWRRRWQLAGVAAIPFAVLPWAQLYWLYLAATPTAWE